MDAVANWMWQGIAVAAAATVLVRAPRALGATARYRVWWVAMGIVLALPFAPVIAALTPPSPAWLDAAAGATSPPQSLPVRIGAPRWTPLVLAAMWIAWSTVATARLLSALVGLGRARRAARPFPAARASRLEHWTAVSASGRHAALVISEDVRYAAVLGGRAPAIAVSRAVAAALDDRDLDRIVVHEWAHVQRRDDRARLVQLIVRAVAGLHPAVWWLDRQIHLDRETACDDWAVDVTGSAKSYAACLTRLAAIPSSAREDILQPAAITSSELTRRVMRLLDDRRPTTTRRWDALSALVVPALCVGAFAVAGVPLIAIDLGAAAARPVRPTNLLAGDATRLAPEEVTGTSTQPAASRNARQSRTDVPPARRNRPEPIAPSPVAPMAPAIPAASEERRPHADVHVDLAPSLDVNLPSDLPGTVTSPSRLPATLPVAPPAQTAYDSPPKSPWGAAADAGVDVGRGSQKAAVATAGFFSKLGKSIARSF